MASSDTPPRDSAYARATKYRSPTICLTARTHVGTRRASPAPSGGSSPGCRLDHPRRTRCVRKTTAASAKRVMMVAVTSRGSRMTPLGESDAGGRTGHPDDGGEAEQKARGETGPGE